VDWAFLGAADFSGKVEMGTASFVCLAPGDPEIRIAAVDARDVANHKLQLPVEIRASGVIAPNVTAFALAAPNPFRQSTTLGFDLAEGARVELALWSVDGRHVRTLVNDVRQPGRYAIVWDGRDDGGRALAPGVYYVRFLAGPRRFTRQVVLLR
jgi:hypothetical protein